MRYDVVLVQDGTPTHRYGHPSRFEAERFIEENRMHFEGRLIIVPEGWKVEEDEET